MLELVEIFDGLFLFVAYLLLTVFVPVALLGFLIGVAVVVARSVLGLIGALIARVARVTMPGPASRAVRLLVLVIAPWAIGVSVVLYGLSYLGSGLSSGGLTGTLAGGVRVSVEALARFQDASMRFWTNKSLEAVLQMTAATGDLHALATFAGLVAERLYGALGLSLAIPTFRWVFGITFGAVALVAVGLAPLRALSGVRLQAPRAAGLTVPQPWMPPRAVAPPPPAIDGARIAVVSPRGDLSRDLIALARESGVPMPVHYSTLEEYESSDPADVVLLDARLLRWSEGSPTTNEHRSRTILAYSTADEVPVSGTFGGTLRSDMRAEILRALVAKVAPQAA